MRKHHLITDEQRKLLLRTALENLSLLQLTDPSPTWEKALKPLADFDGKPLAYQTVWRWLQTDWGKELLAEHKQRLSLAGDDQVLMRYQRALQYQLAIACGEVGEPKDAVAAFKALKPQFEAAGLLEQGHAPQGPSGTQVLIQMFGGSVAVREQGHTIDAPVVKVLESGGN